MVPKCLIHDYLSLHAPQFLLAFQLLVKFAHARRADSCSCQSGINLFFPLISFTRCPSKISRSLLLIFGNPCFSFIASNFYRIVIHICEEMGWSQLEKTTILLPHHSPALTGTSVIHWSSFCLFFPSLPHLLIHSCFSSSHSLRSRFLC